MNQGIYFAGAVIEIETGARQAIYLFKSDYPTGRCVRITPGPTGPIVTHFDNPEDMLEDGAAIAKMQPNSVFMGNRYESGVSIPEVRAYARWAFEDQAHVA